MFRIVTTAAVVALGTAFAAQAQDDQQNGEREQAQTQQQAGQQQNRQAEGQDQAEQDGQQQARADQQGGMGVNAEAFRDFEDTAVRSEDGRDVGEIEQVLVNPENMEIAFTVETSEGFLDIGDDEKIVPMSELEYREDHFVTRMTEQEIEQLPTYGGS